MAPPVDFLEASFLAQLARMTGGPRVDITFERHGFYPAGGGSWSATVRPLKTLARLELLERGARSAPPTTRAPTRPSSRCSSA